MTAVGRGVVSAHALPVVCVPLSCQLLGPVPAPRAPSPRSALLVACRIPPPAFGADSASPAAAGGLEPGVSLAGPCGPSFTSVLPGPCSLKTRLRGRCVPRTGRKPLCHVCVRGSGGAWTGLHGAQNGACPPTSLWAVPPRPPLVLCPPETGEPCEFKGWGRPAEGRCVADGQLEEHTPAAAVGSHLSSRGTWRAWGRGRSRDGLAALPPCPGLCLPLGAPLP